MSSRSKRPAETVPVPQNTEEANEFIAAIGAAQRGITVAQAALDESIAAAKALAEKAAAPLKAEIEHRTRGLQIWAEANRQALTNSGKSKTVALPAGEICWRQRPPSVTLKGVEAIIAALREKKLTRFLRTKTEVDKEAMLKEPKVAMAVPGVSIGSAGEEFVVQPVTAPLAPAAVG